MHEVETEPDDCEQPVGSNTVRGIVFVHPEERFVALSAGKVSFGREPACTVRLEGPRVSRLHATIRRNGVLHVLKDEGSRNGTRLNGNPVSEAPLDDDDVVRIGDWVGVVARAPAGASRSGTLFGEPMPGVLLGPRTLPLWDRVRVLARSRIPVLLLAPTGSGKEVFARALHAESGRQGPFVAQNCAALPDGLAETLLFGHVRGAFTGASSGAPGIFAAADGGTLLLDEVADLPLGQQAKLLRVLEESAVVPVGSVAPRPVDVRVLAAGQVPLATHVEHRRFRPDLLARLAGATLTIPPLAERREEIPRLFAHFFLGAGADPASFQPSLVERLCTFDWPFNVRQLKLVAETMAVLCPSGPIGAGHLESTLEQIRGKPVPAGPKSPREPDDADADEDEGRLGLLGRRRAAWLKRHQEEARALKAAVRIHRGNVSTAARELKMSRQRAQRLLAALEELGRGSPPEARYDEHER